MLTVRHILLAAFKDGRKNIDFDQLIKTIRDEARKSDVLRLETYGGITRKQIISAIRVYEQVKRNLAEGDEALVDILNKKPITIDQSSRFSLEDLQEMATETTHTTVVDSMILTVRKPGYLGETMWDFKHGKKPISAKIEDTAWLEEFQGRKVDVRPQDSLDCRVRIETMLDAEEQEIATRHFIEQVNGILPKAKGQMNLKLPD